MGDFDRDARIYRGRARRCRAWAHLLNEVHDALAMPADPERTPALMRRLATLAAHCRVRAEANDGMAWFYEHR